MNKHSLKIKHILLNYVQKQLAQCYCDSSWKQGNLLFCILNMKNQGVCLVNIPTAILNTKPKPIKEV